MHARRYERGQLIPIFALFLIALMGMSALGVDVGYWRYQQRLEQTAADAGALAGAAELAYPALADWSTAATNDAGANGFTANGTTVTVTAISPPTTGTYAANVKAVQVTVSQKLPLYFLGVLGIPAQWISASATALLSTPQTCAYALSGGAQAIQANGATQMTATTCGFASNGGFVVPGSTVTAALIGYVIGPYPYNGQSYPQAQPTLIAANADPCSTIPGCAYLEANPPNSGTCLNANPAYALTITFQPGRYCTILNDNQGAQTMTFAPGVYEFDGGMNVYAQTITGTGVTFYNGTGGGSLTMQSPSITLSAPTSGNTSGILLYQNPANTAIFDERSAQTSFTGVMYFPTATVQNDGAQNTWTYVVASVLNVFGGTITIPANANQAGGVVHAVLVQ
jgi:Flp pilus assembly protein TadG